jgi:hypothetical protein
LAFSIDVNDLSIETPTPWPRYLARNEHDIISFSHVHYILPLS